MKCGMRCSRIILNMQNILITLVGQRMSIGMVVFYFLLFLPEFSVVSLCIVVNQA